MADIVYVVDEYVDNGFVQSTRDGVSAQSASATISATAAITAVSSATLSSTAGSTQTAERTRSSSVALGGAGGASVFAVATVSPSADLTSTTTASISGVATRDITKELIQAGDETTWETALTWGHPRQDVWAKRVEAIATLLVRATATLNSNSTLLSDGDRTARITIEITDAATLTAEGINVVAGTATLAGSGSVFADGTKEIVGTAELNGVATLQGAGTYQIKGVASASANATVTAVPNRVRPGTTTGTAQATVPDTSYIRFRNFSAALNTTAAIAADGDRIGRGIVLKAGISTLTASARRFRGMDDEFTASATITQALGGRLVGLAEELIATSAATVRVSGFEYVIDPYRVYTVKIEGRNLEIVQETRQNTVKSENRLNTVTAESRGYPVKSETRTAEVQNAILIDNFGPYDRRQ